MKMPHATAKPVSVVRSLLRFDVLHISFSSSVMCESLFSFLRPLSGIPCGGVAYASFEAAVGVVVAVVLYLAYQPVLDVYDFVRLVRHAALVGYNDNRHPLFLVQLFQ